jgi:hypothetical protein
MSTLTPDLNQTSTKKRNRHKLFIPRPDDFGPKELDDLHLHLLERMALNGVVPTDQFFMLDADDPRSQDKYRRHLEYLFHAGLAIRLKRMNAPVLYRCSPKGGRVLPEAGRIDRNKIPRNIRNDSQNYYWRHSIMRGDFRARYISLLRERKLPIPEFHGPQLFRIKLRAGEREEVRTAESDDYLVSPSGTGSIVEVHRMADDYKLSQKVLTYLNFEDQGGASYLGVRDLKVLIITDSPDRVQKLLCLIRARIAWFIDQAVYLQEHHNLARPVWVDPAGVYHSLFD